MTNKKNDIIITKAVLADADKESDMADGYRVDVLHKIDNLKTLLSYKINGYEKIGGKDSLDIDRYSELKMLQAYIGNIWDDVSRLDNKRISIYEYDLLRRY